MRTKYGYGKTSICNRCGQGIVWAQYSSGKWYPADPVLRENCDAESGYDYYVSGGGNHFNWKPRHRCEPTIDKILEYQNVIGDRLIHRIYYSDMDDLLKTKAKTTYIPIQELKMYEGSIKSVDASIAHNLNMLIHYEGIENKLKNRR